MESRELAGGAQARGLLVIGLLGEPFEEQIWIWDLLQRVRPQLDELAAAISEPTPKPVFRKALLRRFRLGAACDGHPRVALVATAARGRRLTHLTHWHIAGGARIAPAAPADLAATWPHPSLTTVRQAAPTSGARALPIWPYWLDSLPLEGLDFLGLPRLSSSSARTTRRQVTLASALLGLLWEILRGSAVGRRDRRAA